MLLIPVALSILQGGVAVGANIDPQADGSGFAYGENVGWINFMPSGSDGVTVTGSALTGLAWGENIGWVKLNPANGGVINDGAGRLSGYAWGEKIGWINFGPLGQGVTIHSCGEFAGKAWGENIGWISFRSDDGAPYPFRLKTSWIPLDIVPPSTSVSASGPGWQTSDVTVTLVASDNACGSGVKAIHYALDANPETVASGATASLTVVSEGQHSLQYFAVDNLNNTEPPNTLPVWIDKTAPVISVSIPAGGATYSINQSVQASYTATDPFSGIGSVTGTVPNGSAISTATPGSKTFAISATDAAGNTASTSVTYNVIYPGNIGDPTTTAPAMAWGENVGWINFKPSFGGGVTVSDTAVTGRAWGQNIGWINLGPFSGSVANNGSGQLSGFAYAENVGWINFSGVTVDAATGAFRGAAWGENIGWINFGLASNGVTTAWRPADSTPPDITITSPANGAVFALNQIVAASYSCADISGVTTCTGPVPSGSTIDTSSAGAKSFTVTATDGAGNTTSTSNTYTVTSLYNFAGFYRPVENLPALNLVKGGRAVPVKFSLGGNYGLNILWVGYPVSQQIACDTMAPVNELTDQTETAGSSSLVYDASLGQYSYVWKTESSWSGTCRQLVVRLKDGTEQRANFSFSK